MSNINKPFFDVKAVSKATDQLMSVQTEQTITSLEVAELTGKRHDQVLRDIRNLLDKGVSAHNFVDVSYKDAQNQERTRDIRNIIARMDRIDQLDFQPVNFVVRSNYE